jgi:MFS family permease
VRKLLILVGAIVFVDTMFFAALTPLLPHYAHTHHLSKAGAGVLSAMYPIGALVAAVPGGVVAARFGVKRTVLCGLTLLAATTTAFGLAQTVWELDAARFVQGISSAFSWTGGLAWLVAAAAPGRRGQLIGSAFAAAIVGALFGPLLATASVAARLPWPDRAWLLAALVVASGFAFGSFWTPAMSMITDEAESHGLDYGYAFALVNIAWAPGQAGGSAIGGAIASATSDAVPYLALAVVCAATLLALARYRETPVASTLSP